MEATDNWAFNIDRGYVNAVVFLDLKKAFDTVDHDILLSKMNFYGIQETALDWFKSEMKRVIPWGTLLTNYLSRFRELISWKTALVIAEQSSGTTFPVMWEKLNLKND